MAAPDNRIILEQLASHLPDLIVHRSSFPAVPETVNKYGVLLFGDISGFTALCERYCSSSDSKKKGADQLTSTLNLYLSKIVQGDALLVHWPCSRPAADQVIQYLIKKSLIMQKKFDNFQTPDDIALRFKIALSIGKTHIHFIGNQDYRTFDITGPAVDEVTVAQSVAKPGTVVVTRVAWEMCNQKLYTAEVMEHGFMLVSDAKDGCALPTHQFKELINRPVTTTDNDMMGTESKADSRKESSRLTMRKETKAFLHKLSTEAQDCLRTYILKTVDHGYDVSWLSELRQVSVLFINLDPDFALPSDILSRQTKEQTLLQTAFDCIYPNLIKYDGTLNKIFMFDKGCTFLCIFGLPYASHEDNPERAIKAAQAIFNALDDMRLSHYSIGVTTGVAFCGVVGHPERHEYTVIGDKVNMAARLMTKFPDGLTCDDTTRLKSNLPPETFVLAPPVKLKGIPTPEDIFFVSTNENEDEMKEEKSEIFESNDYESLVGRKKEMERFVIELQHMTEQTKRKRGAIIISGSGGIGKTKLLRAMKAKASSMGFRVISGMGGLIEQNVPFHTVKTLLTRLLGLDTFGSIHDKEQLILQHITDEKMRKHLPLLNDLLVLKFPQNSLTLNMSNKERRTNLHKLLFSIVHKEALSHPFIFGIDDAHCIDQESWAFILDLALDSNAILLIASRAIPERDRTPVMAKIFSHPTTIRFRLEGLSFEETSDFICQLQNVQEVDKNLLNVIYTRSHGSPLWCTELVDSMSSNNVLKIVEYNKVIEEKLGYARVTVGINETRTSVVRSFKQKKCVINEMVGIDNIPVPESMAGIVLTRIDNMSPSEQMVLKCAAILGNTFHRKMLEAILPSSNLESFNESLNSLAEVGIIDCLISIHVDHYGTRAKEYLSGLDIDLNQLGCSCLDLRRDSTKKQSQGNHSLESCQLLQFVHSYIQETALSLWTESQLKSLHETAALYLESEAHKCSNCGGGSFMFTARASRRRRNRKGYDNGLEISNRRRRRGFSMERRMSQMMRDITKRNRRSTVSPLIHRPSIATEDASQRPSIQPSIPPSFIEEDIDELAEELMNPTGNPRRGSLALPDLESYIEQPRRISILSVNNEIIHIENESTQKPMVGALLEEDELSEVHAHHSEDEVVKEPEVANFQNCHCDEVLADVYPQLVYHWRLAGNQPKTVHYLIEAAIASLVTFNNMEAISFLEEAEQILCDGGICEEDFGQLQRAKLQSLLGQAYFQSGQINECLAYIQKALSILNAQLPTNKIGVLVSFLGQTSRQYFHIKHPQRYIQTKHDQESDMYLEKSRCMAQMVHVYHLQHKPLNAFVAALSQLNTAEEAQEDIHELLASYAAVIECCQKFNFKRLGNIYVKKSLFLCFCTDFGIDDLSTCAHVLNVALNMKLCQGNLIEAMDIGNLAVRLTSRIHLDSLKLVTLPLLFYANLLSLKKEDSHENLKSIKEISGRSKDLRTKALHDCCEFDALLELGLYVDQQDKIAKDAQTFYCSGEMYHFDDAERFFLTSCIALWHSRGSSAYATRFTEDARSLHLTEFRTFFSVQALTKYIECILEQYLMEQDNRQFKQESEKDTSSDLVEYDCVYTNSTVPSCSSVCSQTCFYSLLPATCSPEGNDLVYESISRPDSTGPSVMFDDAYNVPQSVLESLSPSNLFLNPFTLSMWVYPMGEIADNSSVLIQIESMDVELTLYVDSRWLLITNSSSISTMNSYNTTHRLNLHQWTHLTVIASEQDELLIAVNNLLLNTSLTIDPNSDEPISISLAGDVSGDYHFPGLMSDVGVFSNSLSASQVSILAGGFTPPEFLPQCLCREGLESELCDGSLRYRINSHPVEFITDNNVSTYWESSNSSVTVSLGLATVTSLSKIFLDFRDFSPAALRLQYLMEPTKVWNDIQFYARDCSTSFGQEESNSVNSISSVICQAISSNDTSLAFYYDFPLCERFDPLKSLDI
uniref:Guanylate cyclase domain-containing protein n=1 Tax=Amphimedon queenslandica TaxID=400682 RepID=A0A1X7VFP5_AMPQE